MTSDPALAPAARSGGPRPKVVIAGGGCAGLECALRLRELAGGEVGITLVTDDDELSFAPDSIYVPFGLDPGKVRVPLHIPAHKRDLDLLVAPIHGVDTERRELDTVAGPVEFDYLVVATGSGARRSEITGLAEHALSVWTPDYMLELAYAFDRLADEVRGGARRRVVFCVPPGCMCPAPLYEVALMFETWLRRQHARQGVEIVLTTHERSFLEPLGPLMHDELETELVRRGIAAHLDHPVHEIDAEEVSYLGGGALSYDLFIAFPPQAATLDHVGLPTDRRGFIQTHLASCEVEGENGIYAIGDAADFPLKQSLLAFQQADAAAEHIAPRLFGRSAEGSFDPVSMDVLEQLDKGTFANVPLELTGDSDRPLAVRGGPTDDYRVGTSRAWRLGKLALARAVPWRFRRGEPFGAGAFWETIEATLRGMSKVWASGGNGEP